MSPHDDVPNELWMDIFESMDVPQDLHAVVLSCKKFYFCGIRALLRNLVWTSPKDVAANLPAWKTLTDERDGQGTERSLADDVRSLVLGVSTVPLSFAVSFVDENGVEDKGPYACGSTGPMLGHLDFPDIVAQDQANTAANASLMRTLRYYQLAGRLAFATSGLYTQMCQRITTFVNLEKLECRDLLFTDDLFAVIHALPGLRTLYVELCLFPSRGAVQNWDHTVLRITDLKLLNLRRRMAHTHEFVGNNGGFISVDGILTSVLIHSVSRPR